MENGLDVDYVLVYKLSRFGRNAADILNSLALLQTYDVNLICIEEGIDSSQTSGKLLISVLSAVAEIERENILEQTMNGRREKARQGKWNGGQPPYGYMIKDGVLQIEEDEAKIVKMVFEMYTTTKIGYTGIKTFKVEEKIFGFFVIYAKYLLQECSELRIFDCANFALLRANLRFFVQTRTLAMIICRFFRFAIDFLNKICYNIINDMKGDDVRCRKSGCFPIAERTDELHIVTCG